MLKAVIFDDEYIVLQGLSQMINWEHYGVELVGMAEDGLSALSLFRECKPDIVLTDIRMPGLDGLQLIGTAAAESPKTMFIVFSGFNEFEYVRRAIGLGVVDYLEKPITVAKIDEALRKAIYKITREQTFSEMKIKWEESKEELLEKATLDLLLAGGRAEDKWRMIFGTGWEDVVAVTVLAFSDRISLPSHSSYRIVTVTNGNEWLAVVFQHEPSPEALWNMLFLISESNNGPFGSGRTYTSIGEASKSYHEALRSLRYGRFLKEDGWTRIEDVEGKNNLFPADLTIHEDEVIVSLRTGDQEGLLSAVNNLEEWMVEQKLSPERVEQELLKLIYLGLEIAKESECYQRELSSIHLLELHEMHTREEMFFWLRSKFKSLQSWMADSRRLHRHAALEKALQYMNLHYGEDLSLQELAEHVDLNPSYFSLLFKEKIGISYIKYLTGIRMERAKELLKTGLRVNEVSEKVGYINYRHFTELFKKMVGTTPGQYREIQENEE